MRRQDMPKRFELVVCRVIKIFPNSALADLVEYRRRGLIHVSEVALRWVKNIREFIKLNQFIVCQVMRVDGNDISLSLKRVRKPDAERKLNEFKRETKAEKMLELMAKGMKKSLDDAYTEVGYLLQEEFGSIHKAFEFALKNPDLLKSKGVPEGWLDLILEQVRKNYSERVYEVSAVLKLVCYGPDGVNVIKKVLSIASKDGLDVRYVSAPKYVITGKGKNVKELKDKVKDVVMQIDEEMSANKGTCESEIKESR